MEKIDKIKDFLKTPLLGRRFWLFFLIVFVFFGILFSALVAYTYSYNDKVLPGLQLGKIPIGGMNQLELRQFIDRMNDKLINEGLNFKYKKVDGEGEFIFYPVVVSEGNTLEMIRIDIEKELDFLMNYGKHGNVVERTVSILKARFSYPVVTLNNIEIDEDRLLLSLQDELSQYETPPVDSNVEIISLEPLDYTIITSSPGTIYNYDTIIVQITEAWGALEQRDLNVDILYREPQVKEDDVKTVIDRLPQIFANDGLQLRYTDQSTGVSYNWSIDTAKIWAWLEVQDVPDNGFGFGLNKEKLISYLEENVSSKIVREARDAKFSYNKETGKVTEFQGSRPGVELDLEKNYNQINEAILERTWHDEGIAKSITLVIEKVEPTIKTGEVNDLGITEILGVGVSDFSHSSVDRMSNIRNAVKKLNGILVAPGEEFSTVQYTKPYTIEGGYLPELVIKGNEIKKEIGGGLCQIGTTLFRMAMNSGMEITQRRNHSLVVNYYNDPVNGNPGTDATVYDPAPDFRFRNDTGNYILIQTEMDTPNRQLYFTLWGTSDGRKGSYNHPTVLEWLPYGEKVEVETTDLAPGVVDCQTAYRGANTTFTYTRVLTNGEKQARVFDSHYRPLPEICLVGVEPEVVSSTGSGLLDINSSTESVILE